MSIKIMVANQKGGVGKTTSSLEIAMCLAELEKEVLLVDLDQQCNLTSYLNADADKPTIYDVLSAKSSARDAVCNVDGVDFIKASPLLSKSDKEFGEQEDVFLLDTLFSLPDIDEKYDYVIIDTNPARNTLLKMCYCCADYVIFPTECDKGSIDGIVALYNDIKVFRNMKVQFSHTEVLGIILTKYEKTSMHTLALENLESLAKEMNEKAFVMKVKKAIIASETKLFRQSLQKHKYYSAPAMDYRAITEKIIELTQEDRV